jgi:hypothetical protein
MDEIQNYVNAMLRMHSLPNTEGNVPLNVYRGSEETALHRERKEQIASRYEYWIMEANRLGIAYDIYKHDEWYGHKYKRYGNRIRDVIGLNVNRISNFPVIPLDIHEVETDKKNAVRFLDPIPYLKKSRTIEDLKTYYSSGHLKNFCKCRDPDVDELSLYLLKPRGDSVRMKKEDRNKDEWIFHKNIGTDKSKKLYIHIHSKENLNWNVLGNVVELDKGWSVFTIVPDETKEKIWTKCGLSFSQLKFNKIKFKLK